MSAHLDDKGQARMVAIEHKSETVRHAIARASVHMQPETLGTITANAGEKGDVLAVARIAGITAAKHTSSLVPLCHPVRITHVTVDVRTDDQTSTVVITAEVHACDRTGPEMEAMTAATVAALTVYDMCKGIDRAMTIESVCLLAKSGGKSGDWVRPR